MERVKRRKGVKAISVQAHVRRLMLILLFSMQFAELSAPLKYTADEYIVRTRFGYVPDTSACILISNIQKYRFLSSTSVQYSQIYH